MHLIRESGRTPVIRLTARSEVDKLRGPELGADDCVTAVQPWESTARVRAVLRRNTRACSHGSKRAAGYRFRLRRCGTGAISDFAAEFDVLAYLAEREGRVVNRAELLREIWGFPDEPLTRAVDYAIRRLRRKIEPDPHHPQYIHTVHGDGYSLTLSSR